MKIAQIAPLSESMPPKFYGRTERAVSYVTDKLVDQGHDVTFFASGDSKTAAQLVGLVRYGSSLKSDLLGPVAVPRDHA